MKNVPPNFRVDFWDSSYIASSLKTSENNSAADQVIYESSCK